MQLKKLLRQSVIKSVSYIQVMLDTLGQIYIVKLEEVKVKLSIEKERYIKKTQEIAFHKRP